MVMGLAPLIEQVPLFLTETIMFKPGDYVQFISFNAIRYGHVLRVLNEIVWLTNGKKLPIHKIWPAYN